MNALLLFQHAHGNGGTELAYFWASILTVLLPIAAFVALAVLTVRGYFRRTQADGGGEPPPRNAEFGRRNDGKELPSGSGRSDP